MKRWLLFTGIGILIAGAVLIFLSGSMNGLTEETSVPLYPSLYALQIYFTILAFVGVTAIVAGIFLKDKKRK